MLLGLVGNGDFFSKRNPTITEQFREYKIALIRNERSCKLKKMENKKCY